MKRFVNVDIDGVSYPMKLSTGAVHKIAERYGTLDAAFEVFQGKGEEGEEGEEGGKAEVEVNAEFFEVMTFLLAVMIDQGVRYKRAKGEQGVPDPPTEEQLEALMDFADLEPVAGKLVECFGISEATEVELQGKNAAATAR